MQRIDVDVAIIELKYGHSHIETKLIADFFFCRGYLGESALLTLNGSEQKCMIRLNIQTYPLSFYDLIACSIGNLPIAE